LRLRLVRGARRRDQQLSEAVRPLVERVRQGVAVTVDEVAALAAMPQLRVALHSVLQALHRLDLFPPQYLDEHSQAAARLAYWLMHPNELGGAPAEMQPWQIVTRQIAGADRRFHVLRYRMPPGHWAEDHGWLVGLVGPFGDGDPPYVGPHGAFSSIGDRTEHTDPSQLVDWYIDLCKKKGAPW
jgi:hypothetical protein